MHLHRLTSATLVALAVAALFPAMALAQSQIRGQVTDSTGDGLPGVTVEATSPVFIEWSRNTVTDERGNYTLGDLPPGRYVLTFTLPGFSTVILDDLELAPDANLLIGAELQVGAVDERITISGQSPESGVGGIIQLCEASPDGVVGRCRSIIATARPFR